MKPQSILFAALASAPAAFAHTAFTDFFVDGVPQGDAVAMRMSYDSQTTTNPIAGLESEAMACNVGGTKGVSRVQSVKDGALLSFEIRAWPSDPSKERIDSGHKGPCAFYLKKVSSAIDDTATGDGWFKVFEHGYDASTKQWCTDEIINNNGLLNVKLPQGLKGGYYLARPEILSLHAADKGDPQFYTGCAQIFLESTGSLGPESTVSIPGHVNYGTPSTEFDIYNTDNSKYTQLPGPSVAKLVSSGARTASQTSQTEGLITAGCIAENGNWCGKEVADYSNENGCWASSKDCWSQSEKCYAAAPPTGQAGCELFAAKCTGIQDQCNAGNFNGPPNKGTVLTPKKASIDVGKILSGGLASSSPDTSSPQASSAEPSSSAAQPTSSAAQPASSAAQSTYVAPESTAEAAYPTYNSATKTRTRTKTASKTSAAAVKEDIKTYAPAKTTLTSAVAPAPTATDLPEYTITVAPSSAGAPAPTAAPQVCPKGYKCVVVTTTEVVTQYVTQYDYGSYKKRNTFHGRRRHA